MESDGPEQVARAICEKRGMRFVGQVGEGSFKQTFHVVSVSDTPLALKLYKAASSSRRDQREMAAMCRCEHKNIARLISSETYSHAGQQFIAFTEEFLPGGTLTSKGQLTVPQSLSVGEQLVDAVAHIASLNLVHRDIKPDNIMFRSDGTTPVITDFGVVRDLSDSSLTPTWAPRGPGTPFFSAPEQLNNQKDLIDWRTDQFALGIVLAFAAFGDHPYRGRGMTDREVVERVSTRQQIASWFIDTALLAGLTSLPRMVSPWPVDRYRKPEGLKRAWREQKG